MKPSLRRGLTVKLANAWAESGAFEDRPELKQLLRECRLHGVATVIIPTLDRLMELYQTQK